MNYSEAIENLKEVVKNQINNYFDVVDFVESKCSLSFYCILSNGNAIRFSNHDVVKTHQYNEYLFDVNTFIYDNTDNEILQDNLDLLSKEEKIKEYQNENIWFVSENEIINSLIWLKNKKNN